jgi:hypothetical protein
VAVGGAKVDGAGSASKALKRISKASEQRRFSARMRGATDKQPQRGLAVTPLAKEDPLDPVFDKIANAVKGKKDAEGKPGVEQHALLAPFELQQMFRRPFAQAKRDEQLAVVAVYTAARLIAKLTSNNR